MEIITEILAQHGITGIFILAIIYALKKIYSQFTAQVKDIKEALDLKEKENKQIENDFRGHIIENEKLLLTVVQENTKAFGEFSKHAHASNLVISEVLEELKRREYCYDCKSK